MPSDGFTIAIVCGPRAGERQRTLLRGSGRVRRLARNGRRGAQNVPTRGAKENEISVRWRNREVWNFRNRQQRL
eukprot:1498574-Prymnesium_polylepis.1